MTQLTYGQADLDTTEIGYTMASQDRIWVVFVFDLGLGGRQRHVQVRAAVSDRAAAGR